MSSRRTRRFERGFLPERGSRAVGAWLEVRAEAEERSPEKAPARVDLFRMGAPSPQPTRVAIGHAGQDGARLQRARLAGAALGAAFAVACSEAPSAPGQPASGVDYHGAVRPLIERSCNGCHGDGGLAPLRFTTYAEVHPLRHAILASVESGRMPPWPPAADCAEYVGDRSLAPAELELLAAWVEAGGPEGDPGAYEAPPLPKGLTAVDRTLTMAEPYVASAVDADDYRCFLLDWPETQAQYVTGFAIEPGDRQSVHHAIAFVAGPEAAVEARALDDAAPGAGYPCYGGPTVAADWLAVWTPGTAGADYPAGTGIRVEPGSTVILQLHYSSLAGPPGPDQTSLLLSLADDVERPAWIQPWFDLAWMAEGAMLIPAGEPDVAFSSSFDPTLFVSQGEPIVVHAAGIHMHALGKSGSLAVARADGGQECMLEIPAWDFAWQGAYAFSEPKTLRPGDRIEQACRFDNSPSHQLVQNGKLLPPVDVDWGEGTRDEMCLAAFYMTLE